ncbi:hypothetical protein BGW39_006255 [Mortierella sp. 14UC]|nr:hypothetical protein BGW39_006255 [Mortierella sp. 14UC]
MYFPMMSLNLNDILQRCLFLEYFEARTAYHTTIEWTPLVVGQQQPFILKSLILDGSTFRQESLENLLAFTPQLRRLHLISVPIVQPNGYDWSGARAVLRSRPNTLKAFHISTWEKGMCPEVRQHLLEFCLPLSGWYLRPLDVSMALLKELEVYTDRLTILEFYARPLEPNRPRCDHELKDAPTVLHQFLCTSDKLVHLKTLKTVVYMHDLDIHHRGLDKDMPLADRDAATTKLNAAGFWRCRHLQTLHLDIHGHGHTGLSEPVHSRIVFGFVSTLFPLLEELRLYHAAKCYGSSSEYFPRFCLELDGGMCLLGRLKHLQRLEVRRIKKNTWENSWDKDIELVDLNWMVSSGHSLKFRNLRSKIVEEWQPQRIQEDELEATRPQQHQQQEMNGSGGTRDQLDDEELSRQLQHLGLLREVEEMVMKMDSGTFHPLTCLEGLTFNYYQFNHPEEEIRSSVPPEKSFNTSVGNLFGK